MPIRAFIMIQADVHDQEAVEAQLLKLAKANLVEVHPVMGEFDFIVILDAKDLSEIPRAIATYLRPIEGIKHLQPLVTFPTAEPEEEKPCT